MRRYPNGAYSALQVGYAGSFDVELYTGVLPYDNAAGALIVWFFPFTDRAIGKKCFWLSGIYPLVYSIFQWCAEDFPILHIIRIRFTILNLYGKPLQKYAVQYRTFIFNYSGFAYFRHIDFCAVDSSYRRYT